MRNRLFRDMRSAPRDGSTIEVRHGREQEIVLARRSDQDQAWVRPNETTCRPLHWVTTS